MKLNKKMMVINVLATILMTDVAMARIVGERRPSGPSGDSSSSSGRGKPQPSNIKISEAPKDNFQVVQSAATVNCELDMDKEKYFPLDLFTQLSRDEGAGVDIQVRPGNKVVVKIPPVINVCGKFTPELRQDNVTKNVTVFIKLIGTKKETIEVNGVKTVVETKDTLLTHKDLEDCLIEKKIIVDGKIDYDKVPSNGYSESVSPFDYDFDKKKEIKNTVTVSYGYPKSYDSSEGYKPLYGYEERTPNVPGESCMASEKVADNSLFINEGRDVLLEKINTACMSGNAQEIAAARKSLGNADALKDIADKIKSEMDATYLVAVKADVARIQKDMGLIEDKIKKNRDSMTEEQAKKELTKYADLAKELDSKFLNPAIFRLDTLMQKRTAIEDSDSAEVKAIDEEIKGLNKDITASMARSQNSLNPIYDVAQKFGQIDQIRTLEDIRLKSYLYGKVSAVSDKKGVKPFSMDGAHKEQVKRMSAFEKTLNDWTDNYEVANGNLAPLQRTERERAGAITRMNSRYAAFEKKEISDYNSYCSVGMLGSVKNPVKCKEFVAGRDKRMSAELKKREKDLNYIRGRDSKISKMGMNYNEYQRTLASQEQEAEDDYAPYDSDYVSFDTDLTSRFYAGPQMSTAYDASMYNMGGVSGSVNMGQGQMQMAQQQMYGGQQGYQYQMPQQQQMGSGQVMGAWPSI